MILQIYRNHNLRIIYDITKLFTFVNENDLLNNDFEGSENIGISNFIIIFV
jgi:hypothetical protein